MDKVWKVALGMLAQGELVSGAAIGGRLGISRTAVWKHLNQLQQWGVPIKKIKGQGYYIENGIELLSRSCIVRAMSPESAVLLGDLQLLDNIDSTNSFVREKLDSVAERSFACLAERQSEGRGRHGREWVSPYGRNIYLSLSWNFDEGVAAMEGLSLAVGVVVARVIESFGVEGVTLKWPNDILLGGRKVGGVLLEMMGDPVGSCQVVVGIGINLGMTKEVAIGQPWADLANYAQLSRNSLASALLSELLLALEGYSGCGFFAYRDEWESLDAYRNCPIKLITPRMTVRGVDRGVSSTGAIQIEVDGALQSYSGGEISLRSDSDS